MGRSILMPESIFVVYRVYGRESKKIKAKAIDSNTTALDEKKAAEEVRESRLKSHTITPV